VTVIGATVVTAASGASTATNRDRANAAMVVIAIAAMRPRDRTGRSAGTDANDRATEHHDQTAHRAPVDSTSLRHPRRRRAHRRGRDPTAPIVETIEVTPNKVDEVARRCATAPIIATERPTTGATELPDQGIAKAAGSDIAETREFWETWQRKTDSPLRRWLVETVEPLHRPRRPPEAADPRHRRSGCREPRAA